MTRELVIKIKCDFCTTEVSEEDAYSGELRLKGKFYEVDLCPSCAPSLTEKLTPMPASQASVKTSTAIKDKTRKYPPATPKADRVVPCEICGKKCKNSLGIRFHMVKMHPAEAALNGAGQKDEAQ